jgi:prefoldin subunit 5
MTDEEVGRLTRENDYLKRRCAQLQSDVTDLNSEITRMRQILERAAAHRTAGSH